MNIPSRLPWWPEILVLVALSIMLAWVVNVARPQPLPWYGDYAAKSVAEVAAKGLEALGPEQALAVWKAKERLFVDARDADEFAMGHIPGAVNIPAEALLTGLDLAVDAVPGLAKERPLVVYCSNLACPKSREVAEGLKEMGFTALAVMPEGLEGWKAADGPVEGQ